MDYENIVQAVIEEYKISPIDMLGIGDSSGEYIYLRTHYDSYIRTIEDVDSLFKSQREHKKLLEIGSFLGPVSISLKKIGYDVCALDIPEFQRSSSLKSLYERNGIPFAGLNLRGNSLPYASESLDGVIICEVIEHLNFNPLPLLKEINRVLKPDGYIYIAMPNVTFIGNRIKLCLGMSISNPVSSFFDQLDKNKNMVAGLHWREYTLQETVFMIGKMGFVTVKKYYFFEKNEIGAVSLMSMFKKVMYYYPPFRPCQVVIGKKAFIPKYDFWLTEANS